MASGDADFDGGAFSWGGDDAATRPLPAPLSASERQKPLGFLAMAVGALLVILAAVRAADIKSGGHTASYQIGEVVGALLVVCVGAALVRWGFEAVRSREPVVLFASLSPGRRSASIVVVTVVLALVVVGAIVGLATGSGASASSWSSQQGVETHDGFIAGCENAGGTETKCQCVFSHLSASAQYDTPALFNTLGPAVEQYKQTGDQADIPAAYVLAIENCATTS
ncbi:MAG TPA: hypothetical protein VGG41_01020 [Solirubrobacteraceae bacterium]|jgi:hypothetical protein